MMAPSYNGLMLLTTQPLALRKKREEDEIRMNQKFKTSEKPKDCVIRIDGSKPRNNRDQNKRSREWIMGQIMSEELCDV